ncbi:MAG: efflux RND transporter periplasmic adaptor subunit [Nitrospirae bacterium]|nr:efflux RND transporter periplasmic adaptor subunit [Nitrospirota bacterium]
MSEVNNRPRSYRVIGVTVSLVVLGVVSLSLYFFWRGDGKHLDSARTAIHSDEKEKAPHTDEEAEGIHLSEEAKRNIGLATETVGKQPIQTVITVNGIVKPQPQRLAQVSPKIDAIVEKTLVQPWDRVKAGQVLAEVRSRQFGNPPPLIALTAPMSGLISKWDAKVGEAVDPGKVLFEIVDPSVVWVEGDVPEHESHLVRVGQAVRVSMIALPDQVFTGKIVRMGGMVEPEKRTVHVWVEVANPEYQLKPEMFAQLNIVVGSASTVLAVSGRALLKSGGETFVYIKRGDEYLKRNVVVGQQDDRFAEIIEGLVPGNQVVTQGNYELMSSIFIKGGVGEHTH